MGGPIETEEARIASGDGWTRGRWEFPRGATPPHPLAVLLPDNEQRDLDGAGPRRPCLRPFLEIAWALIRRDLACFRCEPSTGHFAGGLDAAWERGSVHPMASRQRVALVLFGDAGARVAAQRIGTWRSATTPLGIVLVAPRATPDLGGFAGIHTHVIIPGAAEPVANGDHLADPGQLRNHAAAAGVPLGITVIDDLTEHLMAESDWIAGRSIPHPRMCAAVADAVSDLLRPRWERETRPPGTAIGTA